MCLLPLSTFFSANCSVSQEARRAVLLLPLDGHGGGRNRAAAIDAEFKPRVVGRSGSRPDYASFSRVQVAELRDIVANVLSELLFSQIFPAVLPVLAVDFLADRFMR